MSSYPESDPRHHTARVKKMLADLISHLRDDTTKFDEPKAQALSRQATNQLMRV